MADNLQRHVDAWSAMMTAKQEGQMHGNEAWARFYNACGDDDQQELVQKALVRKEELGLLGPKKSKRRWTKQQKEQRRDNLAALDNLSGGREVSGDDAVREFDFAAAAAAAAAAAGDAVL
jgi:hypothetical protein